MIDEGESTSDIERPDDRLSLVVKQVILSFSYLWYQNKLTGLTTNLFLSLSLSLKQKTSKEITAKCWSVVLSHPFHGLFQFFAHFLLMTGRFDPFLLISSYGSQMHGTICWRRDQL